MINPVDLIARFQYALNNGWGYIWGESGGVWTQAKQDKATRDMTVKYGQKWVGKHVADCSGLFYWAFKQLGGYMYHGSDTMYRKYCTEKGKLSKGMELEPGTAVFTYKEADGKYGHVGLYVGDGCVIEARGTRYGVVRSDVNNSRWTHWGKLKGVAYSNTAEETSRPTLRKGSEGEYVVLLQTKLIQKGYDLGKWGADGKFGSATETAVKQFQKDHGLTDDGIVGPKTWNILDKQDTPKLYTVVIPHLKLHEAEELARKYQSTGESYIKLEE